MIGGAPTPPADLQPAIGLTLGDGVGVTVGVVVGVVVGVGDPIGCSNEPSSGMRSTHVARHTRPVNVVTTVQRYTVRN
jgi:hypothetical protein